MKLDLNKLLLTLAGALLLFIAGKVWEGVEVSKENQMKIEHAEEHQRELQSDLKEVQREVREVREDLGRLWSDTSDLAKEVQ